MFALFIVLKHLLPDTALATFTYLLVSYHLVLAFKVLTAEKEAALSLPVVADAAYARGLRWPDCSASASAATRSRSSASSATSFPASRPLRRNGSSPEDKPKIEKLTDDAAIMAATVHIEPSAARSQWIEPLPRGQPAQAPSLYMSSTGDDYNEFLELMRQGKRPFRKPGNPVRRSLSCGSPHAPNQPPPPQPAPELPPKQRADGPGLIGRFIQSHRGDAPESRSKPAFPAPDC